jgi:alkyldihydroxyacetonephosphate synthase
VCWPENTEEVAGLVSWCAARGVSVVPYGAGSGVCGGVLPTPETVVLDLKRLNRWRQLDAETGCLDVEAGVLGIRLEEDLQARGWTIGHFPSSILCSTAGGWVAARGAGQCSGRYGKIEDMVASLECVDGQGRIAQLSRRTHGPDLTPLIIGSEGILSVITAARLRLHPAPAHRAFAAFASRDMMHGADFIRSLYQAGLRPAVCRLYDPFDSLLAKRGLEKAAKAGTVRKRSPSLAAGLGGAVLRQILRLPGALNGVIEMLGSDRLGGCQLIVIFEGEEQIAESALRKARTIAAQCGAEARGEQAARHWFEHRYSVSYRQAPMFMTGAFVDTMEVAAPWSRLHALYDGIRRALGQHVFVMAHMSHAYPDGCSIYFTFAGSGRDDADCQLRYDRAWRDAMDAAITAGGTLSHHHGVGRSKAPRMGDELGLGVELVTAVRSALDPAGVLNPGNLLPREPPPRGSLPSIPNEPAIDAVSQTVHASGHATLAEVEATLARSGLSLGLSKQAPPGDTTLDAWIGAGAHGAPDPWRDPVDHLVAGYSAELASGAALTIRPCPRRAVGPDLFALLLGAKGRVARLHGVHLRAQSCDAFEALDTGIDRAPACTTEESSWIERVFDATAGV